MMKRFNIEALDLGFKNLISGPAPIGRILNYIYLIGTEDIYHKNGHRKVNLENNIAYAWTTEFMRGLELVVLGEQFEECYKLELTDKGLELFNLMKDNYHGFSEGVYEKDIIKVREEINACHPDLYKTFKEIFVDSYPFKILQEFLIENGFIYENRKDFMDDLFETVKNIYDEDLTPYNRNARVTTAGNRVPSILQLFVLFDMAEDRNSVIRFIQHRVGIVTEKREPRLKKEIFVEKIKKEELLLKNVEELVERYGEDGTQIVEALVRNSNVQRIFKSNLMVSSNKRCVVCGIEHPEMLIGSHIKPSKMSSVEEKADYNNGLLLCCNHDKLFDRFLITFDSVTGRIRISKTLSENDKLRLGLNNEIKLDESMLNSTRKEYLKYHNATFEMKESRR